LAHLVVIGSDQQIAGIISERDIMRELAAHDATALEQKVGNRISAIPQILGAVWN
jgi:hypothetical protein